jgi:hypothetical protein
VTLAFGIMAGIAVAPIDFPRKLGLALGFLATFGWLWRLTDHFSNSRAARLPPTPSGSTVGGAGTRRRPDLTDLAGHVKEGVIYPRVYVDLNGNPLDGSERYQIVGAIDMHVVWWSVTIYNEAFELIPGTARHAFTNFNVARSADGERFVIDIAPEQPDGAVNWLPCRRGERFNLVWRTYVPGSRVLDDQSDFELPKIVRVGE